MEFVVPRDLPRCGDWAHPQGPVAARTIDVFLSTRFWSDHPKTSSWPAFSLFGSFALNSTRTSVPESGSLAMCPSRRTTCGGVHRREPGRLGKVFALPWPHGEYGTDDTRTFSYLSPQPS